MNFAILSAQVIKTKKYCPNPVIKYGIPSYADAKANPKVVETLAYHQWWEEQVYYIKNGYNAGGLWIPGRYYKYLNFDRAQTAKGAGPMEIHDFQLDFALLIEDLKRTRENAYVPKARRKTMSAMTVGMVIDYGWRFDTNYHAAIVAGLQEYSNDFLAKWKYVDMHMVPEFRVRKLKNNDDEIIAGWREQTEEGWVDCGTQNTIYIKTVNNNANVLKGKFLNDIVYEESGENELLEETIAASEDCLKLGSIQYGTSWIYGTGGNMQKGSKGFKKIHMKPKMFNVREWYIPAYVFLEPAYAGCVNEHGELIEEVPNLHHLAPHERVGWSDFEHGKYIIKKRKEELLLEGDMEKYIDYCKNNPIDIQEIFRSASANNFDALKISDQLYKIESENKQYNKWHFSYKKNDKTGEQIFPLQVEIRPAKIEDNEWECVYILNDGHPVKGYKYLDVAGIDSYDQNQARYSKSLGSMVVFRRQHTIEGIKHTSWAPVALIRIRPKYKEQFYDLCMKLALYYDLQQSVLIDIGANMISKHFQDSGNGHFLAPRPRKFESPNSKQTHETGVSINSYSKPKMVSALQSLFDFHIEKIWFEHILSEALNYDEVEIGSDNDAVDALGIAIMQAISMDSIPMNEDEMMALNPYDYPEFVEDAEGNILPKFGVDMDDDVPLGKEEDYVSRMHRKMTAYNNNLSETNDEIDMMED